MMMAGAKRYREERRLYREMSSKGWGGIHMPPRFMAGVGAGRLVLFTWGRCGGRGWRSLSARSPGDSRLE